MNFSAPLLPWVCLVLTGCASLSNKLLDQSTAKVGGVKIVRENPAIHQCPSCHKRLNVLPVRFLMQSDLDESMTLEQVMAVLPSIAINICESAATVLMSRGYQLVSGPVPLLVPSIWNRLDPATAEALTDVESEYSNLSGHIYDNRDSPETRQLTGYRMGTCLKDLVPTLVSPEAQAVLLMDSKIVLESPEGRRYRFWMEDIRYMIETGGPTRVVHHALLVDTRTREVLWWASKIYYRTNARDPKAAASTLEDFFSDLPTVP